MISRDWHGREERKEERKEGRGEGAKGEWFGFNKGVRAGEGERWEGRKGAGLRARQHTRSATSSG